jgi:hypothetical protein
LKNALIGSTGFVGSSIANAEIFGFKEFFSSKNMHEAAGKSFDLVVCAAPSAKKWYAIQNPQEDMMLIQNLINDLKLISAKKFVLISTVDVYEVPFNKNEDDDPEPSNLNPYGFHRRLLEKFIENNFLNSCIIRLPGLFGVGLKKNIIFDLLNKNEISKINISNIYQWYPINRLQSDLQVIIKSDIKLINISPEPMETIRLISLFDIDKTGLSSNEIDKNYNIRTKHINLLNGSDGYHLNASEVVSELQSYIKSQINK